jgi:Ca-activated chloride channel family protein
MVSCALALACNARLHMGADVSVGTDVPARVANYAAMDEVPVGGGELRLIAPVVAIVEGVRRETIGFPLKHTAVSAKVGGMMAVYEIEQVFENPFDEPIEAVYVFPLGDKGAVSGYQIAIGERTITGEIQTREQARRTYEQAKAAGHTAGLVEQNKPNVFTQLIANIAPRETIRVKLTYVDLLDYSDGSYELAVPLVVGPRYLPADRVGRTPVASHHAGDPKRGGVASIPYVDESRASSTVSFTAEIDAGVPLHGIKSPSHDIAVTQVSPTRARVTFGRADEIPNRDLVVRYTTAGPQTQVGVLTHRAGHEGYFLLTVQPKAAYRTGDITAREVMIVIDRSGSMSGVPIQQAKAVATGILESLTDRDSYNILGFASGVDGMSEGLVRGDAAGKQRGRDYLSRLSTGGGTEMEHGVTAMLTKDPGQDRIRVIYFLTDGFVGNDDVVIAAARGQLGANRIMPVGIGSAPNRYLLDRLAAVGRGFPSYVGISEDPNEVVRSLVLRSAYPYLTDVEIDWGGLRVSDTTPDVIPDVYAGQPLIVSGRYHAPGAGTVKISATIAGRRTIIPLEVQLPNTNSLEPVASLWARRRIEALMREVEPQRGMSEETRDAITQLGLRFHLLTELTSFVAVDRSRVVSNGVTRIVEQPAIVPEGVDPGAAVASSPPPSPSRSYSYDDGNSGGLFSGGPADDSRRGLALAVIALIAIAWMFARRRLRA